MTDLPPSIIRTVVPFVVAWLAGVLPSWLGLTTEQLSTAVVVVLGSVYYSAARVAESRWPSAGLLLGHPSQPTYARHSA